MNIDKKTLVTWALILLTAGATWGSLYTRLNHVTSILEGNGTPGLIMEVRTNELAIARMQVIKDD